MKIVLATGIYPPEIGGPATYCRALAEEFSKKGWNAVVVTYGGMDQSNNGSMDQWRVIRTPRSLPIIRWFRYARALKKHGSDADAVIAFSSISAGVPLWIAHLRKPKKILRLGGDFFWERYTDRGGMKGLRAWYESKTTAQQAANWIMQQILRTFDHIVFSTEFQKKIYEDHYWGLESVSVIENALPSGTPKRHERHEPFRLLFMGRFVGFKNLPMLIKAIWGLPNTSLTFVGDGPMRSQLIAHSSQLPMTFLPPAHGAEKERIFADHDLLILPSLTEISPNVALEARTAGLPVLLTKETGLSGELMQGMMVHDISTTEKIKKTISDAMNRYDKISHSAHESLPTRGWGNLAEEWIELLSR